jgi:hypothetical protein
MLLAADTHEDKAVGEPWGRRLWLTLAAIVIVAAALQCYGISKWPMADDEVLSLVQMGLLDLNPAFFSFPADHLDKLPKAVPVWNHVQRLAIGLLPQNSVGFRLPSVVCAVLVSAVAFVAAARWRGLWFAIALSIVANGSQLFIHVAQINRFYSLPLLLLTLALVAIWLPRGGRFMVFAASILAWLTVLSHNVTVAAFGLAFVASIATYLFGPTARAPSRVVLRSGAACGVAGLTYVLYLMPLIRGWHTTGNPTPVLVSFAAHAGLPILAMALLGAWLSIVRRRSHEPIVWSTLFVAGTVCLFQLTSFSWNPRYFVFFLPPLWILAASAIEYVARRLGYGSVGAVWYTCVILLLLPNLLSHYRDGSRHDYRAAAAVLRQQEGDALPILSDDAETISFYLPATLRERLQVRTKVQNLPGSEFFLVTRANAWTPLPRIPKRRIHLLAEIYQRRYDQFSHVVRVYRIGVAGGT